MKKLISSVVGIIVIAILGGFIYYFFINCEKYEFDFDRYFTLKALDQATIGDEVIVKLVKINDKRYLNEEGQKEGYFEFKLLVLNNMRLAYVTLDTGAKSKVKMEKLKYEIRLIEMKSEEEVTFALSKLKE